MWMLKSKLTIMLSYGIAIQEKVFPVSHHPGLVGAGSLWPVGQLEVCRLEPPYFRESSILRYLRSQRIGC
jgi:hypothetical protein